MYVHCTYVCFTISRRPVLSSALVLFSLSPLCRPCPVSARQSQWYASDIDIEVIQYLCLVSVQLFIGKDGNFPTKSKNFPVKAKLFDCLPFLLKREDWRDDQRIFHSECLAGERSGVGHSWQRVVLVSLTTMEISLFLKIVWRNPARAAYDDRYRIIPWPALLSHLVSPPDIETGVIIRLAGLQDYCSSSASAHCSILTARQLGCKHLFLPAWHVGTSYHSGKQVNPSF